MSAGGRRSGRLPIRGRSLFQWCRHQQPKICVSRFPAFSDAGCHDLVPITYRSRDLDSQSSDWLSESPSKFDRSVLLAIDFESQPYL